MLFSGVATAKGPALLYDILHLRSYEQPQVNVLVHQKKIHYKLTLILKLTCSCG